MAANLSVQQAALPLGLFDQLQHLRARYQSALLAAAHGEYQHARELTLVSRMVGRLMAREAVRRREERGGLGMVEISLAVDQLMPELRGWTDYENRERARRRLQPPA